MAQVKVVKRKRPWQDIAREAQQYRDASIARVWPDLPQLPENLAKNVTEIPGTVLSREEVQITEMSPEGLLNVLASGDLTAVAVTTAFLRRASLAQKLVCLERVVKAFLSPLLIQTGRPTVSQRSSLSEPWPGPDI
jgi:amidase